MHEPERIAHLLFKYFYLTITEDETRELENWTNAAPQNRIAFKEFTDPEYVYKLYAELRGYKKPLQPMKKRSLFNRLFKRKK